jgi:hypothetical protein
MRCSERAASVAPLNAIVRRYQTRANNFEVNKHAEPKIKGDKYATDKKEYRILPWALGRWLVLQ